MAGRANRRPLPRLRHQVAFDRALEDGDGFGGSAKTWEQFRHCRAELTYMRGSEVVEAARLQGRSVFKVRIKNMGSAKEIDESFRIRTVNRGLPDGCGANDPLKGDRYDIREVDALTNPDWIYLIIESEAPS